MALFAFWLGWKGEERSHDLRGLTSLVGWPCLGLVRGLKGFPLAEASFGGVALIRGIGGSPPLGLGQL